MHRGFRTHGARPGGYRVDEYLLLAPISALIGAIAIRTLLAIGRRQLMPTPVPASKISTLRDDAEQTRRCVLAPTPPSSPGSPPTNASSSRRITAQLLGKLVHAPTLELRRQALERSA